MDEKYFWEQLTIYDEAFDFDCRNPKNELHGKIESDLWQKYGCKKAVMMVDMSGFTVLSRQHGIVHYLSMIKRMKSIVSTRIHDYGLVVKFIGDNCLAVFSDPLSAIRFSMLLSDTFSIGNVVAPDSLDIYISCGIDFGDILMVEQKDCFGHAVNISSKLGEDVAKPGQILITQEAMDSIPESAGIQVDDRKKQNISNTELVFYTLRYGDQKPE